MAISEVEAIPVAMDIEPLEEPYGLAPYRSNHDAIESRKRMLIRVETEKGINGLGRDSHAHGVV